MKHEGGVSLRGRSMTGMRRWMDGWMAGERVEK